MTEHNELSGLNIHVPYAWEYADTTAREAATGFVSGDLGKLARQLDDDSLWMLTDIAPIWVAVGGAGGSNTPNFFGLLEMTAPPSTGWTWDNQGSSTIDSTNGYEYLEAPKQSAIKLSGRYRTPANSHWRIEVCMLHDITGAMSGSANETGYAIGFRDSSGKLVTLIMQTVSNVPGIYNHKWTSSTSYSALYTSYAAIGVGDIVWKNPAWLRADYDGTNIVFYYSIDGNHWRQIDTRTLTNFLGAGTPDFFWGGYVNGSGVNIALLSYKETALA